MSDAAHDFSRADKAFVAIRRQRGLCGLPSFVINCVTSNHVKNINNKALAFIRLSLNVLYYYSNLNCC